MDRALERLCDCSGMSVGTGARGRRIGRRRCTRPVFMMKKKQCYFLRYSPIHKFVDRISEGRFVSFQGPVETKVYIVWEIGVFRTG